MKKLIIVLVVLVNSNSSAQKIPNEVKSVFSISTGLGTYIIPILGGRSIYANLKYRNNKDFGFGLDIMNSSYKSPGFDRNPDPSIINNYDPTVDESFTNDILLVGQDEDKFGAISLYLSKGFSINKGISVDFQAGPSLILINQRDYEYNYAPGFGTFSGGSGPSLHINSSGSTQAHIGAYVSANLQLELSRRTAIEFSPFTNLNGKQTLVGVRLGVGFVIGN